jgi:hypothetical protein
VTLPDVLVPTYVQILRAAVGLARRLGGCRAECRDRRPLCGEAAQKQTVRLRPHSVCFAPIPVSKAGISAPQKRTLQE